MKRLEAIIKIILRIFSIVCLFAILGVGCGVKTIGGLLFVFFITLLSTGLVFVFLWAWDLL